MLKVSMALVLMITVMGSAAFADVKYVTSTQMEFQGAVGTMMNVLGGKKPIQSVEYYKDNMKRSDTMDKKGKVESSQIIDLNKELFISLDHRKKEYTQMTFDEWRKMMEENMAQMGQETEKPTDDEQPEAEVDWNLNVDIEETGEKERIAGKPTEKVILTLDMDAKVTETEPQEGQDPESFKGGMIVTSQHWLYKGNNSAKKEMDAFNKKMAEKMGALLMQSGAWQMMGQVLQQNSQIGDAMEELKKEGEKLNGLSMRVETLYETKVDPETAQKMEEERVKQKEEEKTEIPTSVDGLLGAFGKKMAKKQIEKKDQGVKERNTLMSQTTEVIELESAPLSADLFKVPDNYKLVESKNPY